jgi:hypothetical protein
LKAQKNFSIGAGQTKKLDFELFVKEVGEKVIKLAPDFL